MRVRERERDGQRGKQRERVTKRKKQREVQRATSGEMAMFSAAL